MERGKSPTAHQPGTRARKKKAVAVPPVAPRSWLNLRMIEVFVAVVQQDGMTRAAARLGMTQSAVSQAITAIEAGLGVQLIDRSMRPMQLTLFGKTFYTHALDVVRRARALEQVVDLTQHERLPLVRIGMTDSFASTVGPHLLRELAPLASRWSVASGVLHTSLKALNEQLVDVLITSDEAARSADVIALPVLSEPLFIVAPKRMATGKGSIGELARQLPLIRYSARGFLGRQVELYLQHHDVELPRQYELDTSDAVLAMVKAGLGWTITTPLCVLKTRPALNDLQYLPLRSPGAVRRLRLFAHRDHHIELWQRVAATARTVLDRAWIPTIRKMAPWVDAAD